MVVWLASLPEFGNLFRLDKVSFSPFKIAWVFDNHGLFVKDQRVFASKAKILFVDDEPSILKGFQLNLGEVRGFYR